jgi:hypothetical protein
MFCKHCGNEFNALGESLQQDAFGEFFHQACEDEAYYFLGEIIPEGSDEEEESEAA